MDYIEKFKLLIEENQPTYFLKLWEEFCSNDVICGKELITILSMIRNSFVEEVFSSIAETVLVLWEKLEEGEIKDEVLKLIFDLQNTNSVLLEKIGADFLAKKYSQDVYYNEFVKIVGLRGGNNFKGAIRKYELLSHLKKNNFVFHSKGWGVGEVREVSLLQKQVIVEFENFSSLKSLSFENAFKNLSPISSNHFLARRFGNPDLFENFAKEHSVDFIKILLKDLGPKTAQEIKMEVCELIILDKDWNKWWQNTRSKLKKDTHIIAPKVVGQKFSLADDNLTHFEKLELALQIEEENQKESLLLLYKFTRDFSLLAKEKRNELKNHLSKLLNIGCLQDDKSLRVSVLLILENLFPKEYESQLKEEIEEKNAESLLNSIFIGSLKRELLTLIHDHISHWKDIFVSLFLSSKVSFLRDYLFKELKSDKEGSKILENKILEVISKPTAFPDLFLWLFFKSFSKSESFFDFSNVKEKQKCLESVLALLHFLSQDAKNKDICKKLYNFLVADRFLVIRKIIEGSDMEFLKEFLLLSSKCPQFSKSDLTILQNLAEVVQPKMKVMSQKKEDIFWVTQESIKKAQERLKKLTGIETIENAKEIEEARALGDLRENSEYKFALEKRGHIQAEIKKISDGLNKSRILTQEDIFTDSVGIGCVVSLKVNSDKIVKYVLLGQWDANPEENILSVNSKLAQQMLGLKMGDDFSFQDVEYTVVAINSFLE